LVDALGEMIELFEKNVGPLPVWFYVAALVVVSVPFVLGRLNDTGDEASELAQKIRALRGRAPLPEEERARTRQLAGRLADQLEQIDEAENWTDAQFAELDAEVESQGDDDAEVDGRGANRRWWILRREKNQRHGSLSEALRSTSDKLILLKGEPGSGKTVALRHFALQQLRAVDDVPPHVAPVLPIYVNLRSFYLPCDEHGQPRSVPTADDVGRFVVEQLLIDADAETAEVIREEFGPRRERGGWLLLLDSFDEIPAVLQERDDATTVLQYAKAIRSYVRSFNETSCIVASRGFRRPKNLTSTVLTVSPLSEERKAEVVRRSNLGGRLEQAVLDECTGEGRFAEPARNPLTLGLIVREAKEDGSVPGSLYELFDDFVRKRLDEGELPSSDLTAESITRSAERLAIAMTAGDWKGLDPPAPDVVAMIERDEPGRSGEVLLALQTRKLVARREGAEVATLAFSHRRLQEFLCARAIRGGRHDVAAATLVGSPVWREICVTLLASHADTWVPAVVDEANERLRRPGTIDDGGVLQLSGEAVHVAELLQDAKVVSGDAPPGLDVDAVDGLLVQVLDHGDAVDRRIASGVIGLASPPVAEAVVRRVLVGGSPWERDEMMRRIGRIGRLPERVRSLLIMGMLQLSARGQLADQGDALRVQLHRLGDDGVELLRIAGLASWVWRIDVVALILAVAIAAVSASVGMGGDPVVLVMGVGLAIVTVPVLRSWTARGGRLLVPTGASEPDRPARRGEETVDGAPELPPPSAAFVVYTRFACAFFLLLNPFFALSAWAGGAVVLLVLWGMSLVIVFPRLRARPWWHLLPVLGPPVAVVVVGSIDVARSGRAPKVLLAWTLALAGMGAVVVLMPSGIDWVDAQSWGSAMWWTLGIALGLLMLFGIVTTAMVGIEKLLEIRRDRRRCAALLDQEVIVVDDLVGALHDVQGGTRAARLVAEVHRRCLDDWPPEAEQPLRAYNRRLEVLAAARGDLDSTPPPETSSPTGSEEPGPVDACPPAAHVRSVPLHDALLVFVQALMDKQAGATRTVS
jgi:hypothetical protein